MKGIYSPFIRPCSVVISTKSQSSPVHSWSLYLWWVQNDISCHCDQLGGQERPNNMQHCTLYHAHEMGSLQATKKFKWKGKKKQWYFVLREQLCFHNHYQDVVSIILIASTENLKGILFNPNNWNLVANIQHFMCSMNMNQVSLPFIILMPNSPW